MRFHFTRCGSTLQLRWTFWVPRTGSSVLDPGRCCFDAICWSAGFSVDEVAHFWRVFFCVFILCPQPGIDENVRIAFWQELTATVRHVRSTVDLPMVIAGNANVWHPHFTIGRSRSVGNLVVPFVDLLIALCGLRLRGCAGPHVGPFPLPLFDFGPQWVAMLRRSSWLSSSRRRSRIFCECDGDVDRHCGVVCPVKSPVQPNVNRW